MTETERRIREAFDRSEDALLKEWYEVEMQQTVGRSLTDLRSVASPDARASFFSWFERKGLSDLICRDWSYCSKRQGFQEPTLLAAAIADLLLSVGGIAAPVNVALLCVKFYCDRLCKCDQYPA